MTRTPTPGTFFRWIGPSQIESHEEQMQEGFPRCCRASLVVASTKPSTAAPEPPAVQQPRSPAAARRCTAI